MDHEASDATKLMTMPFVDAPWAAPRGGRLMSLKCSHAAATKMVFLAHRALLQFLAQRCACRVPVKGCILGSLAQHARWGVGWGPVWSIIVGFRGEAIGIVGVVH